MPPSSAANKGLADELRRSQDHRTGPTAPPPIRPTSCPMTCHCGHSPRHLTGSTTKPPTGGSAVAAGRHTWRPVKPVQLREMVRRVSQLSARNPGAMKMTDFDAIKPDWMPSSGSHTKTLGLSWRQPNDWRVEL